MNLFEQLYIADLIVKAIAGSLSGEEAAELRLWRESSEENERLYQELLTMGGMELQQKEVALFVPETAWKMLSEKVSGKRKHRVGSNILKYAAVACAVLGIAVSVFYISGNKTPETVETVAVAQVSVPAIAHGSSKAVLILEDGSSVKLDRQSTFQTADATVRNTEHSGIISYKKTEKTEKKEVKMNRLIVPRGGEYNVELADGTTLPAAMVIWTAGITASPFRWITSYENNQGQPSFISRGGRLKTDSHCAVESLDGVYAIGDISIMSGDPAFPDGHPRLAQVALQQGKLLAHNLNNLGKGSDRKPKQFIYKDKGSMATIGRNRAVVDLRHLHFHGFAAWMVWMFIHLISLLGMRNRLTVLINWVWAYFNYSTSLRLLIRPARHPSAGETSLFKSE